jgi:DNA-binding Lrp family transcriptional regulator
MAPPFKFIDEKQVEEDAAQGLTNEEIAAKHGFSISTLSRRCEDLIKRGHLRRNGSLRSKLFAMAMQGNVAAAIWLSKQHLGYREKIEHQGDVSVKEAIDRGKQYLNKFNGRTNGHSVPTGEVSE